MDKKKIVSLGGLVVGVVVLIAGIVFLAISLNKGAGIQDGEYLVSAQNWVLDDGSNCEEANCEPGVIWDFTEIGRGTLTTNNHLNDYDFVWAIEDGKLKIETDWLYLLENEYEYSLDQGAGVLTLKDGDEEIKLIANFTDE